MTDEHTSEEPTQHETRAEALELPDDAQLKAALQDLVDSARLFRKAYLGLLLGEHPPGEVPEKHVRSLRGAERCIDTWADRLEPSKVTA